MDCTFGWDGNWVRLGIATILVGIQIKFGYYLAGLDIWLSWRLGWVGMVLGIRFGLAETWLGLETCLGLD